MPSGSSLLLLAAVAGNYAYIGDIADGFETLSIELLDPGHPVYALRPKTPLQGVPGWCWYAPRDSFVYPGGETELKHLGRLDG